MKVAYNKRHWKHQKMNEIKEKNKLNKNNIQSRLNVKLGYYE